MRLDEIIFQKIKEEIRSMRDENFEPKIILIPKDVAEDCPRLKKLDKLFGVEFRILDELERDIIISSEKLEVIKDE